METSDPNRDSGWTFRSLSRDVARRPFEISDNGPQAARKFPEEAAMEAASRILTAFSERDREALIRFYYNKESSDSIQRALGLDREEFQRIKSRARASFFEELTSRPHPRDVGGRG